MARKLSRRGRAASHLHSIEIRAASVRLGRHWALRDVDFCLRAGERWLLLGANGAGKTVLLKLLRGDLWPTPTGRELRLYRFGRREPDVQPLEAAERVAYLGPERQDRYERYESPLDVAQVVLTGFDDSDFPLQPATANQRRKIGESLAAIGLAGLAARPFRSLSYGQRRRVLLARALVRKPDVLLLDEVLNGLDSAAQRAFLRSLDRAVPRRTAWILTSHRHSVVPAGTTHVAEIADGRILRAQTIAAGFATDASDEWSSRTRTRSTAAVATPRRTALLRLERAAVHRGDRCVIPAFDWTLEPGEHWRIRGPNGSGKSTLVSLLYGDSWPASGGTLQRRHRAVDDWKRSVGLVSPELQSAYAATGSTVEEIVASGLADSIGLNEWPTPAATRRVRRELQAWGLDGIAARRAREVSYGQLRIALTARAFVRPRRLFLLDEPFDGLDVAARGMFRARLDAAVERGVTLVIATHHDEDVPAYVRRELRLRRGRAPVTCGICGPPAPGPTAAVPPRTRSPHHP